MIAFYQNRADELATITALVTQRRLLSSVCQTGQYGLGTALPCTIYICEIHGDSFDDNWLTNEGADDPTSATTSTGAQATAAVAIRNVLYDHFD